MPSNWDRQAVGERLYERCQQLALYSETPDELTRVYLSPQHQSANAAVAVWMEQAGMRVWQDAVGNICGRYEGRESDAPALLLGSHLDTVRNAGRYDGILGVVTAIELVDYFHQRGQRLPFALEVVGFGDEEGTRFGTTLLGSRGLAGGWPKEWLETTDAAGISIATALTQFGLSPNKIDTAQREPASLLGYLEVHIEQGPQLEAAGQAVGVVTAINGAKRLNFTLTGYAGHAGTVPMGHRQDALTAASEAILAIEKLATEAKIVATVGQIQCSPGAVNVIPAEVTFSLDIRSSDDETRDRVLADILEKVAAISARRQVQLDYHCFYESAATACDPSLMQHLATACEIVQGPTLQLGSGAGHDAMAMADICPVGMLFVRCDKGVSHHPDEAVQSKDLSIAFAAMVEAISQIAKD